MAKVFSYNRKYEMDPCMGLKDAAKQLSRALYGPEAKFGVSHTISNATMAQFKTGVVVRIPKGTQRYVKSVAEDAQDNDFVLCGRRFCRNESSIAACKTRTCTGRP